MEIQRSHCFFSGDSELTDYMDFLASNPDKFTTPHNADTGETIVHLLAKEGKVEILQSLLDDPRMERDLVAALLQQDKLGWNPIMTATKADSGVEDMVKLFLVFLEPRMDAAEVTRLLTAENISKDTVFTLLMRNNDMFVDSRRILLGIVVRCSSSHPRQVNERMLRLMHQLQTPNSCELSSRTMKEMVDLSGEFGIDFADLFAVRDQDGNNLLMELAKNMKDDALREVLTNAHTANFVTHSVLLSKNALGQTLLALIEVNRESLGESLPLILKREYGCHRRDIIKTELCLSEQLETSKSASEIIQELHQLEPKSFCQILLVWMTLLFTSLTPNLGAAVLDIFSDAYLVVEYHANMKNQSYVATQLENCSNLRSESPTPLDAYASCLDSRSKFYYTLTFLLIPLIFYLTEFLTLRPEYEPTGMRRRITQLWRDILSKADATSGRVIKILQLLAHLVATAIALILWQPVTAVCKFYRDGKYLTSEGMTRVGRRTKKRCVDLAASRGELIEVSIEAVFEPMVQGYIIFPSLIKIMQRLANSITVGDDGTVGINFELRGIETAQIFSISVSMVSLAWCFSEYNSVRKNMLLDITISPCSRIIMCVFMLFRVVARLLAFMLFTLFWGPGNFYPLMIFVGIHMVLAAILHIVFSEDIIYWRKGLYLKFLHNVMMNSFASIYFHNYLRFDEMPVTKKKMAAVNKDVVITSDGTKENTTTSTVLSPSKEVKIGGFEKSSDVEFIDSQRPGLHISTFMRQVSFDILYSVEYVVLLSFGFSSDVKDLTDESRKPIFVSVILVLNFFALGLKLFYYTVMHVWNNVIISGKKLTRREFTRTETENADNIHSRFFRYVFISRNTWILGRLKHIETTLIVLPKRIIEQIKGRGQDLDDNLRDVTRQVADNRSWLNALKNPREFLSQLKLNNLLLSLLFFPLVILVIVMNVAIIALLLVGLFFTIPVLVLIFLYNLKSGFRAVEIDEEKEGQNTLELPPEIDRGETTIFNSDPGKTLASLQKELEENNGILDLSRKVDYTADEFEVFAMLLLSLNRKRYPLRTLILDNCDITDEKLIKLCPLIVKFDKVYLNGSQKMTVSGWDHLANTILNPNAHSRLKVLGLRIAKNDDDVMRFRREVLLEELKGSTMTADALCKIASFIPRLEKVFLDEIFNDSHGVIILDMIVPRSDNFSDAWKALAHSFQECPVPQRKLRVLSLPGCSINDDILNILAPALVRIKKISLGRNPITVAGWQNFKNCYVDAASVHDAALTHLWVSSAMGDPGSGKTLLHGPGALQIASMLPLLEEADLSGQPEIGNDGWAGICDELRKALEAEEKHVSSGGSALSFAQSGPLKLRLLKVGGCRLKDETKKMLEDFSSKCELKVDFGQEEEDGRRRKKCFCC